MITAIIVHFYYHNNCSLKPNNCEQSPSDNDEQDHNIEQDIECEEGSLNSKEYACYCA